jgi:hypothetical protein
MKKQEPMFSLYGPWNRRTTSPDGTVNSKAEVWSEQTGFCPDVVTDPVLRGILMRDLNALVDDRDKAQKEVDHLNKLIDAVSRVLYPRGQ